MAIDFTLTPAQQKLQRNAREFAVEILQPPTITNLIAMAAPHGGGDQPRVPRGARGMTKAGTGGGRDRAARDAWGAMADLVLDNERRREVSEQVGLSFGKIRALRRIARRPMPMKELASMLGVVVLGETLNTSGPRVLTLLTAGGLVIVATIALARGEAATMAAGAGHDVVLRDEAVSNR